MYFYFLRRKNPHFQKQVNINKTNKKSFSYNYIMTSVIWIENDSTILLRVLKSQNVEKYFIHRNELNFRSSAYFLNTEVSFKL